MKTPFILFDFDFTLVDASGCLFGAIRAGLLKVGVTEVTDDQLKPLIGLSLEKQFSQLAVDHPDDFPAYKATYMATRSAGEAAGTRLLPGVVAGLHGLHEQGFTLGIVSTGAAERIKRALERFKLTPYLANHIHGGAEDKASVIRQALSHCHIKPENALYVGDRPDDGLAASRAGVGFIAVTTGAFGFNDFAAGTTVIASLAELPALLSKQQPD